MDHAYQYLLLIDKALGQERSRNPGFHLHHIVPRSLGGTNDLENLVYLTHKEHMTAHTLLAHIFPNQWSSVEALSVSTGIRLPKWKRTRIAHQRAKNFREANKKRAEQRYLNSLKKIDQQYTEHWLAIIEQAASE